MSHFSPPIQWKENGSSQIETSWDFFASTFKFIYFFKISLFLLSQGETCSILCSWKFSLHPWVVSFIPMSLHFNYVQMTLQSVSLNSSGHFEIFKKHPFLIIYLFTYHTPLPPFSSELLTPSVLYFSGAFYHSSAFARTAGKAVLPFSPCRNSIHSAKCYAYYDYFPSQI